MNDAYPLIMALAAFAGLLWTGHAVPKIRAEGVAPTTKIDAGLATMAGGLPGARAGFVVSHWSYYSQHLDEILAFWEGGLSWSSGALGALVGLYAYSALARRPFWPLADAIAMPAVLVSAAAWFGCMLDGCSYGRRVAATWIPLSLDLLGNLAPRWPTQAVGVMYSLGSLGALLAISDRRPPQGLLACLGLSLIAAGALGLSFTRADPVPMAWEMRLDGLASAALLALSLGGVAVRAKSR